MAWRRLGDKPVSEPIMVRLSTHICVTRPQCVNKKWCFSLFLWTVIYRSLLHKLLVLFGKVLHFQHGGYLGCTNPLLGSFSGKGDLLVKINLFRPMCLLAYYGLLLSANGIHRSSFGKMAIIKQRLVPNLSWNTTIGFLSRRLERDSKYVGAISLI